MAPLPPPEDENHPHHNININTNANNATSKKRIGRKLTKHRKPTRSSSVQYPDRLKDDADAQEDVTAPQGKITNYMNQSVFSMIAAAGSRTDFNARFDDESSGSDTEQEGGGAVHYATAALGRDDATPTAAAAVAAANASPPPPHRPREDERKEKKKKEEEEEEETGRGDEGQGKDIKRKSESRLRRSLPKLNLRTQREKNYMSQSSFLPEGDAEAMRAAMRPVTPRDAPVMSRMIEAQAQLNAVVPPLPAGLTIASDHPTIVEEEESQSSSLVKRLMEIFGLEKPEEVISGTWGVLGPPFCTPTRMEPRALN